MAGCEAGCCVAGMRLTVGTRGKMTPLPGGKRSMRRSTCLLLVVLFWSWLNTFGQSAPKSKHPSTGEVLIVGGICNKLAKNGSQKTLAFSELYDVDTKQFVATGSLHEGRAGHTATVLDNGEVLVTGGDREAGPVASAEIYDPTTGTFGRTGSMKSARVSHTAVLLPSGSVLIAGGQNKGFITVSTAELFDPRTGTFR